MLHYQIDLDSMSKEDFAEWLAKNPRACNWVYYRLVIEGDGLHRIVDSLGMSLSKGKAFKFRQAVNIAQSKVENGNLNVERHTYRSIKGKFHAAVESWAQPRWLDEKDEKGAAYLYKKLVAELSPTNSVKTTLMGGCAKEDFYYASLLIMDLWETSPEAKALFLKKASASWSQKKHRDSRKGKKAINCYIDEKSRDRLDELAEAKRRNISEMLGDIIDDAYDAHMSKPKR